MIILCYYFMGQEIKSQSGSARCLRVTCPAGDKARVHCRGFSYIRSSPLPSLGPRWDTQGFPSASWTWRQLHNFNIHPSMHSSMPASIHPFIHPQYLLNMYCVPSGKALKWWAAVSWDFRGFRMGSIGREAKVRWYHLVSPAHFKGVWGQSASYSIYYDYYLLLKILFKRLLCISNWLIMNKVWALFISSRITWREDYSSVLPGHFFLWFPSIISLKMHSSAVASLHLEIS